MKLYDDKLIVVTGGAGFIGSHVIQHLNESKFDNILVVDNLSGHSPTPDKWKNLVGKKFADILHKGDLFQWLQGREDQVEAILHLGACSSTVEQDANYLLENNYRYSVRLAEYALHHNIRFVYASSAATYGDGSQGFSDDHDALETLRPLNMYGYSKHLFDLWAKNEGVLNRFVGLKYFNVFGPNEYHKGRMASALLKMYHVAKEKGTVELFRSNCKEFSDGEQKRDFIYVKDVAKITCAFLKNEHAGIYNVGSGRAESWNDLATSLFLALKKEPKIAYIDMPADLIGKYQNYTRAETQKVAKALKGSYSTHTLQDAVRDYVVCYLDGSKYA